ncbi:Guanylate kinase [Beauveria bassiana D1-5]|uniref:guanylate kinase n=1 Tax=Beauveria bassiana D1-5 TaxID=1245745 RepID=A0A0A2VNK6_BEABA|nr:Guanylate kinase [Beauveria bassiana D1-5]
MAKADNRPVVISGPSGVGKGTLIDMLLQSYPNRFTKTASHTTRLARVGEEEGVDYFYISQPEFKSLISRAAFIEYTLYNGHYYGTSIATVAEQTARGLIVILEIDVDGAGQLRKRGTMDARYIFVRPPSLEELEVRLRGRGSETEESVQRRLLSAQREMEQVDSCPGLYDKIIVSDDLGRAYKDLVQFVLGESEIPQ